MSKIRLSSVDAMLLGALVEEGIVETDDMDKYYERLKNLRKRGLVNYQEGEMGDLLELTNKGDKAYKNWYRKQYGKTHTENKKNINIGGGIMI